MAAESKALIEPVRRTVEVRWSQGEAFRRFTAGIADWWPLRTHSVGQSRARTVIFEEGVGGRIREQDDGGAEHVWGTVLEWDPPSRVLFSWHPGREASTAQKVEVRFEPTSRGTRLRLVHSGWEVLGRSAARMRRGYSLGWVAVLDLWAERSSPLSILQKAITGVARLKDRLSQTPDRSGAAGDPGDSRTG